MKTAVQCQSMADIRVEIDRLDESLMRLFAERWSYIGRAGEIKTAAGLPADIPSRVDEVRANVRRHAADLGLDPAFYDAIWTELIRHSIVREEEILAPGAARDA